MQNRPELAIPRERWQAGQRDELADWVAWLDRAQSGADAEAAKDLAWRLDPEANFADRNHLLDYVQRQVAPGGTLSVLDVGAGPLSALPKKWITRTVNLTIADPLADEYAKLLPARQIAGPPVAGSVAVDAESLSTAFAPASFDVVFARNAFEQFRDPFAALEQMLGMVKPGHWVLLLQEGYRTDAQTARGPWTLIEEDDDAYLVAGGGKIDLAGALQGVGDVRVVRSWHYPWLMASIRRA
jgi:SAM-dependent methyltransferase